MTTKIAPPWETKRSFVVKAEEETNPRYGHKPEERPIQEHIQHGIINLDKPPGPSSHEVTAWVKRILNLKQAGHGGTLEALTGPGKSQGDRSPARRLRRSHKGDSSPPPIWKRIHLCHETPRPSARRPS